MAAATTILMTILLPWANPSPPQDARPAERPTPQDARPAERPAPQDARPAERPAPRTARAAKPQTSAVKQPPWIVGVLPAVVTPEVAAALEKSFRQAVEAGLTQTGHMVVADSRVETVRLRFPLLDSCRKGSCVAALAKALQADVLVRLRVQRTGKNYVLQINALDPKKRFSASVDGRCDICTLTEAKTATKKLALEMGGLLKKKRAALPRPPSPLDGPCSKDAECMKGLVCVDGKCAWKKAAPPARPPPKKVTARPRPRPRPRVVKVKIKKRSKPKRKHPWGQFAIATGAAGLVSIIVGASLVAVDGKPSCDRPHGKITCTQRYDTKAAGAVLLTAGILGGAASGLFGYLWWRANHKKKKQKKVALSVFPLPEGGGAASATFRF